ncbi:MAG: hypothetical protein WAV41_01460 [Microgenomates group bacterium]
MKIFVELGETATKRREKIFDRSGYQSKSWNIKPYRAEEAINMSAEVEELALIAISARCRHPMLCVPPKNSQKMEELVKVDKEERQEMWQKVVLDGLTPRCASDIEAWVHRREEIYDNPEKYYIDIYRDAYGI